VGSKGDEKVVVENIEIEMNLDEEKPPAIYK
jgi:hypothetical protein